MRYRYSIPLNRSLRLQRRFIIWKDFLVKGGLGHLREVRILEFAWIVDEYVVGFQHSTWLPRRWATQEEIDNHEIYE